MKKVILIVCYSVIIFLLVSCNHVQVYPIPSKDITNFNEEEVNININENDFIRRSYNILSKDDGINVITIGVDKDFIQNVTYDSNEDDINITGEILSISNDKRYVAYINDTINKTVILDVFTNESFEISLTTAFTWFEDSSGFCYVPAYESSQNRIFIEKFKLNGRVISEYILSRHMTNGNYIINLVYDQVNNCIFYNTGYFGDVQYDKNQAIDINELTLKSTYSFMIECDEQSYKLQTLEDGNMIFINYLDGYIFCIPSEWKDKYEIYVGSSNGPIYLSYEFPYNGDYRHQPFGDIYFHDAVESIELKSDVYNNEFYNTHISIQKPLDLIPIIGQYKDEYFVLWDMLFDEKNEFYGFIIGESAEKAIEDAKEYYK